VLLLRTSDPAVPRAVATSPMQIGPRVAIVADADTRWHVLATDGDHTEIFVDRGTVTARLFPGEHAHRLALRGANIAAFAKGTVYSLTVDDAGGTVEVHEGVVEVEHADGPDVTQVRAGERWPRDAAPHSQTAAESLLALAPPAPEPSPIVVDAAVPSVTDAATTAVPDAAIAQPVQPTHTPPAAPPDAAPPRSLTDRWRQARLLRGQGDFDGAIRECLAIADARDATWSPIALIEAARIEIGPRASPERAISLVDRFLVEWTTHQLAPEARELRCRALRQLGRDSECTPSP
jgi:hypothetical protein